VSLFTFVMAGNTRTQINIDYHIKGRQCSDVKHIGSLKISNYYKRFLESWSFFLASQTLYVKEDILDQNIFGNAKFSYNGNALFFNLRVFTYSYLLPRFSGCATILTLLAVCHKIYIVSGQLASNQKNC
jgi:hypothetical protein